MKHYPVTTQMWRGVFNFGSKTRRPLMAACSWKNLDWEDAWRFGSDFDPKDKVCPDCNHYVEQLIRLGIVEVKVIFEGKKDRSFSDAVNRYFQSKPKKIQEIPGLEE